MKTFTFFLKGSQRSAIFNRKAIDFFKSNLQNVDSIPDIIFLDINMPIKDGWQFLEDFKALLSDVKKDITIYMVSSSVDDYDIKKSKEYSRGLFLV